jgi:hypothetical protein
MEVKLAPGATHGRPLLLAKAISDLTTLKGGECMFLAGRLFDGQFTAEHPALVTLANPESLNSFREICASFGIDVVE